MRGARPLALLATLLGGLWCVEVEAAAEAEGRPELDRAASRLGLRISARKQMDISADELVANRGEAGREVVLFRSGVRATQEDLELLCDELEAVYEPDFGRGPVRISARGRVRIRQAGNEARCETAVLDNRKGELDCRSGSAPASLHRGDDVVEGQRILFDLHKGELRVEGGARVHVMPPEATE